VAGWIDVSVLLRSGMVHWPDNPPVRLERAMSIERGDPANVSSLSMGVHTATHMDAPRHFLADGAGIDQLDLEATIGSARLIEIADPKSIKAPELARADPQPGERLLLKTRNSSRAWWEEEFDEDFVWIARDAAALLAERGVRAVGVDYVAGGGFHSDGPETHHALLGAGIGIIEGLDLSSVEPGLYDLVCLPVKLAGCDGAPARAIVRPRPEPQGDPT